MAVHFCGPFVWCHEEAAACLPAITDVIFRASVVLSLSSALSCPLKLYPR